MTKSLQCWQRNLMLQCVHKNGLSFFRITALFSNSLARIPLVRHAAQIWKPPCTTKKILRLKRQNINEIKETDIQFSNSILGWTLTNIVYAVADERLTKGNNGGNVQSQWGKKIRILSLSYMTYITDRKYSLFCNTFHKKIFSNYLQYSMRYAIINARLIPPC